MMRLGAHVSIAGGLANAPANARRIGADAIQIFTSNQRQWRVRRLTEGDVRPFRAALESNGITFVVAHASYLLNLASPERGVLARSRKALAAEVRRCAALGVSQVVLHPGAHMGAGERAGVARVAESLDAVLDDTAALGVELLVEGTAGQGTSVGCTFEQLAEILGRARHARQLGVCLDTCHLFAAGHDLATPAGHEATWRAFGRTVGFRRLRVLHLNDSARGLGSHVDRHAPIGRGALSRGAFRRLVNDRRLAHVPMILETPGPLAVWRREIALLRRLAGARAEASSAPTAGGRR
jgi:deoxyribonuclease-4